MRQVALQATKSSIALDHRIISSIVCIGCRVLDLGCGDGELMSLLVRERSCKVQGIEISEEAIYKCVEKGLNVFHGDIDKGLIEFPDKSFDYVILNQSMQQVRNAGYVVDEALRVGKKVIIGFPNFAHIQARSRLFFKGRVPITKSLPYRWYDTPNIHFLSINDFKNFCGKKKIKVINTYFLGARRVLWVWPNVLALNAIFVLSQ
ncbi:MAG: methionine biosynthesis protein MetW [Candidatus Omnitrophota bacterium]